MQRKVCILEDAGQGNFAFFLTREWLRATIKQKPQKPGCKETKMKLSFEQIRALTKGAVRVFEEDGGVCFRRFTEEQERLYSQVSNDFYGKTYATAGVRLELVTDSRSLAMTYSASSSSSRRYFCSSLSR